MLKNKYLASYLALLVQGTNSKKKICGSYCAKSLESDILDACSELQLWPFQQTVNKATQAFRAMTGAMSQE